MVDSAADPVDGPTKIEQRQAADEDTNGNGELYVPPEERKARNIRDYHRGEIARLNKAISEHQYIVDVQTEFIGDGEEVDPDALLPPGTDIGARFREVAADIFAPFNVDALRDALREYDLPVSGTRDELIERYVAYHNGELDEEDDNSDDNSDDEGE